MKTKENKILLHLCCGPCGVFPTGEFQKEKLLFDAFFYNPNIHPYSEFLLRLENAKKLAEIKGFDLYVDSSYSEAVWETFACSPNRCDKCYGMRFDRAFEFAKEHGYKAVSTSLLVSPYQNHELIKRRGFEASEKYGVPFFYRDFRGGFRIGQEMAKEMGLYRQKFCGCILSLQEKLLADLKKEFRKDLRK